MPIKPKPRGYKNKNATQWSSTNDKRYHLTKWRKLRATQIKLNPLCKYCEANGIISAAVVADHVIAVRLGGEFWDVSNLQSLCVSCHNSKRT